jgi:glutaredoxin
MRSLRPWVVLVVTVALPLTASCKHPKPEAEADAEVASAAALPVVKDDTEGLLFAWADEKGEFHVVEKTSEVPIVGRDIVRVMDPTNYDTSHPDRVFIADLRVAGADGTYPVRVATREELDAMALARRGKTGPTLASAGHPAPSPAGSSPPGAGPATGQGTTQEPAGAARPVVIIYGASWCGACHQAAAYLKQRGVPFVEKDIEADANAAREMQSKLARAGKRGGSIPVLDVRGKVMVGFNPQEVDSALGQTL